MSTIPHNGIATVRVSGLGVSEYKGRISFANPEVSPNSRINLIRVTIPNPGNKLKPGMPAYIMLKGEARSTLTLPADAVIREANMATVWIQTGPNTFKSKMVTLGQESDNQVEITSGLKAGDVVVTSGAYLLNSEFIFKRGANPMAGHNH